MNNHRKSSDQPNIAVLLSLLIILLAFAVRVYRLEIVPLNLDEIRTINRYVSLPLLENFLTFYSNNHALASALGHLFSPQADNLFLLRWPTVLLGVISLPAIYRLGTDLFGWRVGLVALFLLGFSPAHLGYSMILRGYIGLISFTAISLLFLVRALRRNRWPAWLAFALTNTAIIHFHMFGVVAVWMQVGLVGLWLLWSHFYLKSPQTARWKKFGPVILWLLVAHLPIIYLRTTAILSNEIWPSAFEVWRNGQLSLIEEATPIFRTIAYLAPMTPGGVGLYLYLFFFGAGLIYLVRYHKIWLAGVLAWFTAPFVAIGLATQFSAAFYAYERFTFYLLPSFVLLIAVGMVWAAAGLRSRLPDRVAGAAVGLGAAALVGLLLVSTGWYRLAVASIDWWSLAQTLAAHRQPQDITICEEPHGFDVPDRAKAYCIWMLDFFRPDLEEYTPKFQSSTNVVASYDYLQRHRAEILEPGAVWLILWQRTVFHPGGLQTDQQPEFTPRLNLPPAEGVSAWPFGRAVLVRVNSEPTLFGNLYRAVSLLSQANPPAADRARYLRSLAQMEAFRGQKAEAQTYYDQSWAVVEGVGSQYPNLFLLETNPLLERIPPAAPPPDSAVAVHYPFDPALCLRGYQVKPPQIQPGQPLDLTIYWQALDTIATDYVFFLELINASGQPQGRFEFDPFSRTYPTPWWMPGQRLVENHRFVIPVELPLEDHTVRFGVFDRADLATEIAVPLFTLDVDSTGRWRAVAIDLIDRPHCPVSQVQ